MTSSTDYVEAVQQISFIACCVCFFSNKDRSVWGSAQCGSMWITWIVGCRSWMPWYDWITLDSFCSSQHVWSNQQ